MNEVLVLDASVIAKLIANEPGSAIAERLFADERFSFIIPGHALAEVCEAVCRKIRKGEAVERQLTVSLFPLSRAFETISIERLVEPSMRLSLDHGISFYDALYVALAVERNVRLLTEDTKLCRAFAATKLERRLVSLASIALQLNWA